MELPGGGEVVRAGDSLTMATGGCGKIQPRELSVCLWTLHRFLGNKKLWEVLSNKTQINLNK